MPIVRHDRATLTDHDAAKLAQRGAEQWLAAIRAWFWTIGPGARCGPVWREAGKEWDAERERDNARRDLAVACWSDETLRRVEAENRARRERRSAIVPRGPRQPRRSSGSGSVLGEGGFTEARLGEIVTVERDWPPAFAQSTEDRRRMFEDVMGGRHSPMAREVRQAVSPTAVAEVLFDGDDQGNDRPADDEWWPHVDGDPG